MPDFMVENFLARVCSQNLPATSIDQLDISGTHHNND